MSLCSVIIMRAIMFTVIIAFYYAVYHCPAFDYAAVKYAECHYAERH